MRNLLLPLACAAAILCAPISGQSSHLTCAGSTFAAPLYEKWITAFEQRHPGSSLAYQAIGSQAGLEALEQAKVDFAASDFTPSKEAQQHFGLQIVPIVVGAAVPVYNLPNLSRSLRFTPEILAEIYLGKITQWNDPQLHAANRDLKLPAETITVLHRDDGSGTSYLWSDFLSQVSPEWKAQVGVSITPRWPVGTAAAGSQGLVDAIARTPNSIGYVELIYALRAHLSVGSVKNSAGEFVAADIDSVTEAASTAARDADGNISLLNATGRHAYPVSSVTWFVISSHTAEAKWKPLQAFIDWALTAGQSQAGSLGFVALPAEFAGRERTRAAHLFER